MSETVKLAPGYDWRRTALKVARRTGGAALLAGLAVLAAPETRDLALADNPPRELAIAFVAIHALAVAGLDYSKHRDK